MPALAKLNPNLGAVLAMAKLDPQAMAVLTGCSDTAGGMGRLQAAGELAAAAQLGGFALPRREAVWWATMCASHTAPPDQPSLEVTARETVERWVRQQDDATRRQAMALARETGFKAPESWAAVAAFWSGDSMSPLGQPAVPPAPHLAGTAVAGAVALASVRGGPALRLVRLERFLASLREIADGGVGRIAHEMTAG